MAPIVPYATISLDVGRGEHTITVVVDDGTDQVEESFVVRVKEEEESPGPGLVAVLAAVVLAGLVGVRRRGRRPT
jgi:MYXO-CTERM domain-containing protein